MSQTHYMFKAPIRSKKTETHHVRNQFILNVAYKGQDSRFQSMLFEVNQHDSQIESNGVFKKFYFHPELQSRVFGLKGAVSEYAIFSVLTRKTKPILGHIIKTCCGYSVSAYIVVRLVQKDITLNALSKFLNNIQVNFYELFMHVYTKKSMEESVNKNRIPLHIINPKKSIKLFNDSHSFQLIFTGHFKKLHQSLSTKVVPPQAVILNTLNMHLYDVSMSFSWIPVQLTLDGIMCRIAEKCILAYLLYYSGTQKSSPNKTVPLYYKDFPVNVPNVRFPGTKVSIISMIITQSAMCHSVNCSLCMISHNVRTIIAHRNSSDGRKSLIFTPICQSKHIRCHWKGLSEELDVDYRLCHANEDPYRDFQLPPIIYYEIVKVHHSTYAAKIPRFFSWADAQTICHNLNQSLPTFNSRREIVDFIDHWYPAEESKRIYTEVAVFINLKIEVSRYHHFTSAARVLMKLFPKYYSRSNQTNR